MEHSRQFRYLTLIELVIALGIMAAIASVTLSMLEESTSMNRFKRTNETGKAVQKVINASNTDDGVSRFISDMGRLPVVISTDEGKLLSELYDTSANSTDAKRWSCGTDSESAANENTSFANDSEGYISGDPTLDFPADFKTVNLPCGWGGPYLYNSHSGGQLFDGWRNEWTLLADASGAEMASPAVNSYIYGIKSLGSNNSAEADGWSEQEQVFKFDASDSTTTATNATLIVTIMQRSNSSSGGTVVADSETVTETPWTASKMYSIGDGVTDGDYKFRCKSISQPNTGTSGTATPTWDVAAAGNKTNDNNIVWEYTGSASGDELSWTSSTVYRKDDSVQNSGNAFTCYKINPISGSSAPSFSKEYGTCTADGNITWECIYPEPFHINCLRVAYFTPCVTGTKRVIRRLLSGHNGDYESPLSDDIDDSAGLDTGFTAFKDPSSDWLSHNQVELKNLTPGYRKLYVYGFYHYNDGADHNLNKYGSDVIELKLKPGVNRITAYLTNEL